MNKKGFTLTELLVVIAIISIITLIAVPSVIAINRNMNRRIYSNKVETIISAAEIYATNNPDIFNGRTEVKIYVKELIETNYMTADVNSGSAECASSETMGCVIDPRDRSSMNDKWVILKKKGIGVSAEFNGNESQVLEGTLVEQVCKRFSDGTFTGKWGSGDNNYCGCKFNGTGVPTGIYKATKNGDELTVGSEAVTACIISGDEKNNYLKYDGVMWRVMGVYNIYNDGNKLVAKIITNDTVDAQ